jgi:hypothetical protein
VPTLTRDVPKRRGRPPGSSSANARAQDRRDASQEEAREATPTDPRLLDPVAMLVRERFDRAKRWRATDRIGPVSVDEALNNSYRHTDRPKNHTVEKLTMFKSFRIQLCIP